MPDRVLVVFIASPFDVAHAAGVWRNGGLTERLR